jgi:hypothetical protein
MPGIEAIAMALGFSAVQLLVALLALLLEARRASFLAP